MEEYIPNSTAQLEVDSAMEALRPIFRRLQLHPSNHRSLERDREKAADVLIALIDLTKTCTPEARRDVGKIERLARDLHVCLYERKREVERLSERPVEPRRLRPADRIRPRRREARPAIRRRVARRRAGDSRDPSDDGPPHRRRPCAGDDERGGRP